jgi:methionine biosynthesis protein MetW
MTRKKTPTSRPRIARSPQAFVRLLLEHMDPALADLEPRRLSPLFTAPPSSAPQPPPDDQLRWQDDLIERKVPAGASVLDLGCGAGELLVRLMDRKRVRGQGIELDPAAVFQCVERGVPVLQANLDEGLKGFSDRSFDYVILEETLQTLHRPVELLKEMLRVGRHGIVSFPNFAYWQVRFDLACRGRMPVTARLPRRWYDTANIHLLTIQDFLDWTKENHVRVVEGHALANGAVRPLQPADNLYAEEALFVIDKPRC